MGTFGARAEKRNVLRNKKAADVLPLALLSGLLASVFFRVQGASFGSRREPESTDKRLETHILPMTSINISQRDTQPTRIGPTENAIPARRDIALLDKRSAKLSRR